MLLPIGLIRSTRNVLENVSFAVIQLSMNGGGMNPPTVLEPTALSHGKLVCGADRDRTDDLRLAKPALSQLSYSPFWRCGAPENRVGQGRVELPTSRLSGVRSNHLSYWPSQVTACAALGPLPRRDVRQAGLLFPGLLRNRMGMRPSLPGN